VGDAAKSCSALAPLDAGEAWIDKQGKDEWNEMVWQIELISDQMLDFIEDIHDSLFFGFHNTVGKMLVMGKCRIIMMGCIVISEYHFAILIDQMEPIFQPSISLEIFHKLHG